MSSKDVAGKYVVPKKTLSIWVKNKEKTFRFTGKGSKSIFNWILSMQSQNLPLSAATIQ